MDSDNLNELRQKILDLSKEYFSEKNSKQNYYRVL